MAGAAITIDNAAAADTIQSVKKRVFAANRNMPMRRQRLVYRPGPHGMEALADDETLGGAGVARDGSAELDLLLEPLTEDEIEKLGTKVLICFAIISNIMTTAAIAICLCKMCFIENPRLVLHRWPVSLCFACVIPVFESRKRRSSK
jgi:hypothetical protein